MQYSFEDLYLLTSVSLLFPFWKRASKKEKEETLKLISRDPRNYIAQPLALLSTTPTFEKGSIEPRHLDLRPFILTGEKSYVTVGGLLPSHNFFHPLK